MPENAFSAIINPSIFNELLAGSVGGAAQIVVGQPLDTIRVRAQLAPREFLLFLLTIS